MYQFVEVYSCQIGQGEYIPPPDMKACILQHRRPRHESEHCIIPLNDVGTEETRSSDLLFN